MSKFLILILVVFLTACTASIKALPVESLGGVSVQLLVPVTSSGPMAVSVDGHLIAWGDTDLNLFEVGASQHKHLLSTPPDSLCWSPDGDFLAAVVRMGSESHLYVFARSGVQVFDKHLRGRVGRLQWPKSGDLTVAVLEHKDYSFGTHISATLVQWDGRFRMKTIPLYEATITPATASRLAGRLHETLDFDVSPLGDEVLYSRLYAPPAFAPARHLVLRNLQTEEEHKGVALPLLQGSGRLMNDGESAIIANGVGDIIRKDLWRSAEDLAVQGDHIEFDAASGLLLVDHQLFQDLDPLLRLPQKSQAKISVGGKFLLVKWHKNLYLLTGYPVQGIDNLSHVNIQKLQKIRRLRSRGLIDPDEYQQGRERLLQ